MRPAPIRLTNPATTPAQWAKPEPRRPLLAGLGRLRKIALLGGAKTLAATPWDDPTWELWAHSSCRMKCKRQPDILFDLHPPELWKHPKKKFWDPSYYDWLKVNHIPIYMQDHYPDIPSSLRYPFETMITEFPRGYMTNTSVYMIALALMQGVTHLGMFGCQYQSDTEYGPQRGSMEYWCGLAEGRGVHVLIPPGSDLLNKPSLLYGYQSHPEGVRAPEYTFAMGSTSVLEAKAKQRAERNPGPDGMPPLFPATGSNAPALMTPPVAPTVPQLLNVDTALKGTSL